MRFYRLIAVLTLIYVALPLPALAQSARVPSSDGEIKLTFAPVVKRTAPAVVNIYTRRVVQQRVPGLFNDPFFSPIFWR